MARRILAAILKLLSKWAISKHNLKIAVVAGTSGTKITGEMFGEMLSKDHFVRKQLEKPFWDFSIPLTILGIEDRRYNFVEWIIVIFECLKVLLFGKSRPGWVVLQMNTLKKEIANYWLDVVDPEISIIANFNGELLPFERKIVDHTKKKTIYYPCKKKSKSNSKRIDVGEGKDCDIRVSNFSQNKHGSKFSLTYKGKKCNFVAAQTGIFMKGPIIASTAALIAMGKDMNEVSEKLQRVEMNIDRFIDLY